MVTRSKPLPPRNPARAILLAAGIGLLALGLLIPAVTNPPPTRAQAPLTADQAASTADLVVDFGDGRVSVERIGVEGPAVDGLAFLGRSSLDVVRGGAAVCAIGGVGCPATDCFCQCKDPNQSCTYWAYFHGRSDGGWDYDQGGAANHTVAPGAMEGWVWDGARPPITATAAMRALAIGVDWLRPHQSDAGGIADHVGFSSEAAFAARGAGVDPLGWRRGGASLTSYIGSHAGAYAAAGSAQAGKALAGTVAAGVDPRTVAGGDLVAAAWGRYDPATGKFGATVWDQAWAMIGLAATGEAIPPAAVDFLAGARSPRGGWGFTAGADEADADSTGLAIQALRAAGMPSASPPIAEALDFLDRSQSTDGGWSHGGPSNANSTAYAVQGILAAGEDPQAGRWRVDPSGGDPAGGANPVAFLLSTQRAEGHFAFDAFPSDLVATLQVLPALAGRPAPVAGLRAAADRGVAWMLTQRTADGAFDGFNPGATIDAVIALAATGRDPNPAAPSGKSAADYLHGVAADYAGRGASASGKLAVGIVALGEDPRAFGGTSGAGGTGGVGSVDAVAAIRATYQPISETFGAGGPWDNAWAILGLAAAREAIPQPAVQSLLTAAATGGGWAFAARADAADVDSTGLVLQALAAARVPAGDPAVRAGIGFLWRAQRSDGGFPGFDGRTSASSTAMAVGGLAAYGHVVDGPGWMRGATDALARYAPREAIAARQSPRGGFAGFAGPDDPSSTYAAVLGLAARPLPVVLGGAVYLPFAVWR
jgi:hypothetical protein